MQRRFKIIFLGFLSVRMLGTKIAIRKIKTIDRFGVTVGLFGWPNFYLKPNEIIKVVDPEQ